MPDLAQTQALKFNPVSAVLYFMAVILYTGGNMLSPSLTFQGDGCAYLGGRICLSLQALLKPQQGDGGVFLVEGGQPIL